MKYAIMSDVHAHPAALEKALKDARAVGGEKFILLGDITGYGYDPKRALELVRENFDVVLMGNHDSACLGLEPEWEVEENVNYILDRKAHEQLSESELEWLRERRYLHTEDGFVCAHGDFTRPEEWNYIFEKDEALQNFFSRTEKLMFCGHTHSAAIWEQTAKGLVFRKLGGHFERLPTKAESISFKVNSKKRYIVNVGSVGYPRNDFYSSYGIFDSEAGRVTIRRMPFDFKQYTIALIDHNIRLPDWLGRVLALLTAESAFGC